MKNLAHQLNFKEIFWLQIRSIALAGFLFALPQLASANTFVSTQILTDTTWSGDINGVYIVPMEVAVAKGTTLTITPGTIVKFIPGNGRLVINGNLIAQSIGTSSPIVFTSWTDDEIGGDTNGNSTSTKPMNKDWLGIVFNSGSTGLLDNIRVSYGGFYVPEYQNNSGFINNGGNVSLDNSTIYQNGDFSTINNGNGTLVIRNSTILGPTIPDTTPPQVPESIPEPVPAPAPEASTTPEVLTNNSTTSEPVISEPVINNPTNNTVEKVEQKEAPKTKSKSGRSGSSNRASVVTTNLVNTVENKITTPSINSKPILSTSTKPVVAKKQIPISNTATAWQSISTKIKTKISGFFGKFKLSLENSLQKR